MPETFVSTDCLILYHTEYFRMCPGDSLMLPYIPTDGFRYEIVCKQCLKF